MEERVFHTAARPAPKKRQAAVGWPLLLSYLSSLLLVLLALCLVLLTTFCSAGYMRGQIRTSSFDEAAYNLLYDNYVSYGSAAGFSEETMTAALSPQQIETDMENAVTDLYAGDTALDVRNEILNASYDAMKTELQGRGVELTADVQSAIAIVADACRQDYANYVAIPLASQLYTLITKCGALLRIGTAVLAVFLALAVWLMLRLAGEPRMGVRCLTFTFTAAAVLCLLAGTLIYPALNLGALNLEPASLRLLILSYVKNLLGRFDVFALLYGGVAAALFALMGMARAAAKNRTGKKY